MKKGHITADELSFLGWTPSMIRLLGKGDVTLLKVSRDFCRRWKSRIYVEAWRVENVSRVQQSEKWQALNKAYKERILTEKVPMVVGM
jgi:hypothetical protein